MRMQPFSVAHFFLPFVYSWTQLEDWVAHFPISVLLSTSSIRPGPGGLESTFPFEVIASRFLQECINPLRPRT